MHSYNHQSKSYQQQSNNKSINKHTNAPALATNNFQSNNQTQEQDQELSQVMEQQIENLYGGFHLKLNRYLLKLGQKLDPIKFPINGQLLEQQSIQQYDSNFYYLTLLADLQIISSTMNQFKHYHKNMALIKFLEENYSQIPEAKKILDDFTQILNGNSSSFNQKVQYYSTQQSQQQMQDQLKDGEFLSKVYKANQISENVVKQQIEGQGQFNQFFNDNIKNAKNKN